MIKRAFLILLCLIFMIFHADLVTKGAVSGLLLWYSSVVPALFPFMVLSSVLSASGGVQALMRPFPVIFRFAAKARSERKGETTHRNQIYSGFYQITRNTVTAERLPVELVKATAGTPDFHPVEVGDVVLVYTAKI